MPTPGYVDRLPPSALLDTAEAAEYLHVSPRTLEAWRVRGGGPLFRKLGRRVLYDPDDLFDWLEDATRTSTSDCRTGGSP